MPEGVSNKMTGKVRKRMGMSSLSSARLMRRALFIVALILAVPAFAGLVLYAKPFDPLRRAVTESLLSSALNMPVEVNGSVRIDFGWTPIVALKDIVAKESGPSGTQRLSVKSVQAQIPLAALIVGETPLDGLVVDGVHLAVEIAEGADENNEGGVDIAETVSDFVRLPFADNFRVRDATFDYVNHDTGFDLHYALDEIVSRTAADGGVKVAANGRLNDEAWKLDADVDAQATGEAARRFMLAVMHAGLEAKFVGTYSFDTSFFQSGQDAVDITLDASVPALSRLLAIYEISGDLAGSGDVQGRLKGPLDALQLSDLALKLAFDSGDTYELSGGIANLIKGKGLGLGLEGTFSRKPPAEDGARPFFDLGISGFRGRIEGSFDGILARNFHVFTRSVRANLQDIGPITAERLYKDDTGRIGLYDLVVLAGDPERPSLRLAGTVKDVINFEGVGLKGEIDFLTADLLDLAAEANAEELGHFSGDFAISDADGTLGVEKLSAKVTDSRLISLSTELVFDDLAEADELKLATRLDIPKFQPFAAALGSEVEQIGPFRFDGRITGNDSKIGMAGTATVGQTTLRGSLAGKLSEERKPMLSGDIATELLHLADLSKLAAINAVYRENSNEADTDVVELTNVWESLLVDLEVNVAAIAGGGQQASNMKGRITYSNGAIGLEPLSMTYLGGRASANGTIDTTEETNRFALKGKVSNLRIGKVLEEMEVDYPMSGALHMTYDVSGAAGTTTDIPRSLNGSLTMSLHNGWIGTSLLDLTGMTFPSWLFARGEAGSQATIVCAVAPFFFRNGRGDTNGLVLETRNVQVAGAGYVDFRKEEIDLRFRPQALQRQLINVPQPFAIQGKLDSPRLTLGGAPVAGAAVNTLALPLNLLGSIVLPRADNSGRVPCRVEQNTAGGDRDVGTNRGSRGPLGLGILGGQRRR